MATEIKFGTDGWREKFSKGFNIENVNYVIKSIIDYVKLEYGNKKEFIIGYDGRLDGFKWAKFVAYLIAKEGFNVKLSKEIVPTPVIAFTAKKNEALGIMLTASHNPPDYFGIKFIPDFGGPAEDSVTSKIMVNIKNNQLDKNINTQFLSLNEFNDYFANINLNNIELVSFKEDYFDHLENIIDFQLIKTLKQKIVFDALHSASIGFFDEILQRHNIPIIKLNDYFDPEFNGKLPDPKPKYLNDLIDYIKNSDQLTIGLSNDGDADRYGVINENGQYVTPNEIMGILLLHLKNNRKINGCLIKTVGSSVLLDILAKKLNVNVIETKVGFKWVGSAMRSWESIIAGEESGGLSCGFHIPEKDGIFANLLILEALAYFNKTLVQLQEELIDICKYIFINDRLDIDLTSVKNFDNNFILNAFEKKDISKIDDKDGLKIYLDNGLSWILVRKSGTEPLLRIYFESYDNKKLKAYKQNIMDLFNF